MMIDALLTRDLSGQTVLDMGCGTGVLGIFAKKCGAEQVVAVDIDDKSVANTLENAQANHVLLDGRLGDTPPEGSYDLILANIHRNILLAQMPDYSRFLKEGGELWLSGFYETDCAAIISEASRYGLETIDKQERGEWRWLAMKKLLNR
jgi:ribosomal protein L11 methyltransferase